MNLSSFLFLSMLALLSMLFFYRSWKYVESSASSVWRTACLFWRGLMIIRHLSFVIALGLCAFAFNAPAQLTQTTLLAVTNTPAVVTAIAGSNTTTFIDIQNNSGLAIAWQFNLSAGTSNADLLLYPSIDKTNFETTPWVIERNAAGTTDRVATTNWNAQQLRGYTQFKIGAMTNANNGTLSNKSLLFSRPNP